MVDPVRARFDTSKMLANLTAIDRATARASMWTVRAGGRKVKQFAKQEAPVYRGPGGVTRKQFASAPLVTSHNRPVKGLYKAAIHSRKQLIRVRPGVYANRVAPRGLRVHLYTRAIEARYGVMRKAQARVEPLMPQIALQAWNRAIGKG